MITPQQLLRSKSPKTAGSTMISTSIHLVASDTILEEPWVRDHVHLMTGSDTNSMQNRRRLTWKYLHHYLLVSSLDFPFLYLSKTLNSSYALDVFLIIYTIQPGGKCGSTSLEDCRDMRTRNGWPSFASCGIYGPWSSDSIPTTVFLLRPNCFPRGFHLYAHVYPFSG